MNIDFSKLFHAASKDRTGGGEYMIPHDTKLWPLSWSALYYKIYPRLKKIPLPSSRPESNYFELIKKRRSDRGFTGRPISLAEIGTILEYSCGRIDMFHSRRAQPSGGGRYPIEVYAIVLNGSVELPGGLYHYNVKSHALDTLWEKQFSSDEISQWYTYPWARDASVAIVMTAIFDRNQMKYGPRGYRHVLIEAGHIGQNVYLASNALSLKCTAIDGVNDSALEDLLEVDGHTESVVYNLLVG